MFNNIFDLLIYDYEKKKNNIAVETENLVRTYEDVLCDVNLFCAKLRCYGIDKSMRIGIQLPNSYLFVKVFFALQRIGCTVVLINYDNWLQNIEYIVENAQLNYVITDKVKRKAGAGVLAKVLLDYDSIENLKEEIGESYYDVVYSTAISEDVSLIIYTSGSTGQSKGIILTHRNVISGTEITSNYLKITSCDRIFAMLPFSFDYGLNQLLTSIYKGATLFIKNTFSFFDIPRFINKHNITGFAGVPSIWINLLNLKQINRYEYKNLRYITNSGGALPDSILEKLKLTFRHSDIYLMYGLTECFRCTYLNPDMYNEKRGSIGKAIPGCEVFLINDLNKLCKPKEVGQIVFRGPTVGKGYLNNEEDTKRVFRENLFNDIYSETVVFSGDYAYMDEDGYLYFEGRRDNQLKKNGFRFNASHLENELYKYDIIEECCVVSCKNANCEDDVYIFLKQVKTCRKEEYERKIYMDIISKLPSYLQPKEIIILDEIPKEYNSKYSYEKLNMYIKRKNYYGE